MLGGQADLVYEQAGEEEEWVDPDNFVLMAAAPKRFQPSLDGLVEEATSAGIRSAQ